MSVSVECHQCGRGHHFADLVPFRAECEGCAADLHVCLGCRFYDRFVENQCREDAADPVAVKERRNLCEYWKPREVGHAHDDTAAAKAKLAALFGGPVPASPQVSSSPVPSASSPPDEATLAKRKLEALFRK
jgi:hypothetical protein